MRKFTTTTILFSVILMLASCGTKNNLEETAMFYDSLKVRPIQLHEIPIPPTKESLSDTPMASSRVPVLH